MRNKYIFVVLTTLLFISGIALVLKERQAPQNSLVEGKPVGYSAKDWPVKDPNEAQRSLFQPLVPETSPMPVTPVKRSKQRTSPIMNSDATEQVQSDLSTGKPTISGRKLLQGNQHKQRGTQFSKVGFNGQVLPDTTLRWSCARDKRTGLLWETKLFDAGISDVDNRYSWYAPDRPSPGLKNRGTCYGIACDTHAYAQEMNRLGLCGSTRWRLPEFAELETLLDRNYFNPVINQEIFFNTRGASYWTQSQLENNPEMIMQIDFFNGTSSPAPIYFKLAVRLVSD